LARLVGIATREGLDREAVEARFSVPIQTSPEAHPASCTIGAETFPVVKQPELGSEHTLPSSVKGTNKLEL